MALHVFAATSGNFWEAPRAAIAVKKTFHWSEWSCRNSLSIWLWLKRTALPFDASLPVLAVFRCRNCSYWMAQYVFVKLSNPIVHCIIGSNTYYFASLQPLAQTQWVSFINLMWKWAQIRAQKSIYDRVHVWFMKHSYATNPSYKRSYIDKYGGWKQSAPKTPQFRSLAPRVYDTEKQNPAKSK